MTIWVDVTDLMRWTRPQVTGIQRILTAILVPLTRGAEDVRLVHVNQRGFAPTELSALPEVLKSSCHLAGHIAESDDERQTSMASPADARGRSGIRFRPLDWLTRSAPQRAKRAVDEYRRAAKELRRALLAWAFDGEEKQAARSDGDAANLADHPFSAGDALLVFGANWGDPAYDQALRWAKSKAGVRLVSLVCDLIPTLHPEWVTEDVRDKFTSFIRGRLSLSDMVLTISEFSKSEILRYCAETGLSIKDVGVIRLGDELLGDANPAAPPRFIPDKPFVLCVSTIELRKNHHCLYVVWKKLVDELGDDCPDLVLVGTPYLFAENLVHQIKNDPSVKDRIHIVSDAPDSELVWYYSHCLFTVYPSLYEGWGIPVAESLSHGRYCIASNAGSVVELGGPLVDYFDPLDPMMCRKLIARAVREPDYVAARERVIRERHKPHSWAATADQVLSLVKTALKPQPQEPETFAIEER